MKPIAKKKPSPAKVVIWKNPYPQGSKEAWEFSRRAVEEATSEKGGENA